MCCAAHTFILYQTLVNPVTPLQQARLKPNVFNTTNLVSALCDI